MQIDGLTVIAQIINFLLLIYLLKRFLYRPVLAAMDRRERRIATQLEDARQREQEAAYVKQQYETQRETLEHQAEQMLNEAKTYAENYQQQLLEKAREHAATQQRQWQEGLRHEQQRFLQNLKQQGALAILHATRQVLKDLAERDLEHQIARVLIGNLSALDEAQRRALAKHNMPLRINSTFAIGADLQNELTTLLQTHLGAKTVVFAQEEGGLCGIALIADDHKISWNIEDYLQTLEQRMMQALHNHAHIKT